VAGTAGEHNCPGATAASRRRRRVARVFVIVYRPAAHGRCRFLQRDGRLSAPRSCRRSTMLAARGTTHWSLRLAVALPPGRYVIRAVAVDRLRHRQPSATVSPARFTVR